MESFVYFQSYEFLVDLQKLAIAFKEFLTERPFCYRRVLRVLVNEISLQHEGFPSCTVPKYICDFRATFFSSSTLFSGKSHHKPVLDSRSSSLSCFCLILCLFESLFKGERWRGHLLCLFVRSQWEFDVLLQNVSDKLTFVMFVGLFYETDEYWSWKWRRVRLLILHICY